MGGITSWVGDVFGGGNKKAETGRRQQEQQYMDALNMLKGTNEQAGPSAYNQVKTNPALMAAQQSALARLQGEGATGGMTAADKATQQQFEDQAAAREKGQRDAILQNAQSQNATGGSGGGLASALTAQQGSAQRGAMQATQGAADARQRALQAMTGAGNLAGNIRGQEFGEQAQAASAKDAIERFNAGRRLDKSGMVAGAGQKAGDMYANQGMQKKQENQNTWGGAGDIVGSVLSFL